MADALEAAGQRMLHEAANMRSKVEPMKEVAQMIRNHFDGIVAGLKPDVNGYQNPRKSGAAFFSGIENASTGW